MEADDPAEFVLVYPAASQPARQPKKAVPAPKAAPIARPKPPPGVLAPGASVKVIAIGDDHEGQIGVVNALLDDDGDGLTVSVKFKGETEPYAFRRDELKLE